MLINGKEIIVEKLKLSKYADVLNVLESIPQLINDLPNTDDDQILSAIPKLIAKALPEVVKILEIATPLTFEELLDLGLDEATDLLLEVIEVNNIGRVAENLKKLFPKKDSVQDNGSTLPLTS